MYRGIVKNADSKWDINVGSVGANDTVSHSGREKVSAKMLSEINQIIENAVLLDTEASQRSSNKKHNETAWMHKLYAFVDYNGAPYIAKVTVEEYGSSENAGRRFYNLRGIKIEPVGGAPDANASYGTVPDTDSTVSISDLYALVKQYDKDFSSKPANPDLLNEDGTPKVFYHGSKKNGGFTVFRPWQYFTEKEDYAKRNAEREEGESFASLMDMKKKTLRKLIPSCVSGWQLLTQSLPMTPLYHKVRRMSISIRRMAKNIPFPASTRAMWRSCLHHTSRNTAGCLCRIAKSTCRRRWTKSDIPRLRAHLLRHTFATRYLENGGDLYSLQQILGHTSLEMVRRYVHFTPRNLQSTYAQYSPLDRMGNG